MRNVLIREDSYGIKSTILFEWMGETPEVPFLVKTCACDVTSHRDHASRFVPSKSAGQVSS